MEENNKYYRPHINEYCLNFECEVADSGTEDWTKASLCPIDLQELFDVKCSWKVRVKYLDTQDIESEGWEAGYFVNVWADDDDIIKGFSYSKSNTDTYILFYDEETKVVGIYLQRVYNEITGNWSEHIMFSGTIQNLSEFRKIQKQLGIK